MNKKTAIVLAIVLGIAGISWFGYKQIFSSQVAKPETKELYQGKITIGYTFWPGYGGLYLASDNGYFKESGLDVEVRPYDSWTALSQDYVAGVIQGKANLTLDAISEAYDGLDHRIVLAIDHSNGSDGIIASSSISRFEDIRGKRVAFEHGTLEEFFLRYALDQYGMSLEDIIPIDLNAEKSAEAVVQGEADAGVTYEPFMSQALLQGGGNKIYSSADAPGLITDVLTFHADFIDTYPDTVEVILRTYFKAMQFWKENPDESALIIAKRLNSTAEEITSQLAGITVLDLADNRTAFTFAAGLESLYGNSRNIGDFIREIHKKGGTSKINTDTLIDPSFIRRIIR